MWSDLRKKTQSSQPFYNLTPFHANPLLPQALRDGITQVWFTKSIKTFGDLYKNGVLESFEDLTAKYSLDKKHFFKFLQLKHYIRTEQGGRLLPVTKQPLDDILSRKEELKGLKSYMYIGINSLLEKEGLKVREKWEADLFPNFEDAGWTELCEKAQRFSYDSKHIVTQYNVIHRIYHTPERLHNINQTISQYCPRCKSEVGSLLHMFWSCSQLSSYWETILKTISKITKTNIPPEPRLILLGDTSILPVRGNKIKFIRIALTIASKCIALKWKSEHLPPSSLWLSELTSCIPNEKIMYNLKQRPDKFEGIWDNLIVHLNTVDMAG